MTTVATTAAARAAPTITPMAIPALAPTLKPPEAEEDCNLYTASQMHMVTLHMLKYNHEGIVFIIMANKLSLLK